MVFFKKILGKNEPAAGVRGKAGARAYAVGDIHGRLDLLNMILARIEEDMASRDARRTFIVFLGD